MTVAVVHDFERTTLDRYDEALEARGLVAGGAGPEGLLFHWATAKGDGVRVVEVWYDRDAYEAARETSGLDALGQPTTAVIPVHAVLTAGPTPARAA